MDLKHKKARIYNRKVQLFALKSFVAPGRGQTRNSQK